MAHKDSSLSLLAPPTPEGRSRPGRSVAISYWGFPVDSYEGDYGECSEDGIEMIRISPNLFIVTYSHSVQKIPEGESGTISHRFLIDKPTRQRYEDGIKLFCSKHKIQYRDPHWRIACKGGTP